MSHSVSPGDTVTVCTCSGGLFSRAARAYTRPSSPHAASARATQRSLGSRTPSRRHGRIDAEPLRTAYMSLVDRLDERAFGGQVFGEQKFVFCLHPCYDGA